MSFTSSLRQAVGSVAYVAQKPRRRHPPDGECRRFVSVRATHVAHEGAEGGTLIAPQRLRNRDRLSAADVAAARSFDSIAQALKGA